MYEQRKYREWVKREGLTGFNVTILETDLYILADCLLHEQAIHFVKRIRRELTGYIEKHPDFLTSLEPLGVKDDAPECVKSMLEAGVKTGVGPMAAVAGMVAEYTGKHLLKYSREIIVENGGDIFLSCNRTRTIAIYAGNSPLSGNIGLVVNPGSGHTGICTSSGTVGHSLSFGRADAAVVVSPDTPLADAAATALCNIIKTSADIDAGIAFIQSISGVKGALIIKNDRFGAWGDIEICALN